MRNNPDFQYIVYNRQLVLASRRRSCIYRHRWLFVGSCALVGWCILLAALYQIGPWQ